MGLRDSNDGRELPSDIEAEELVLAACVCSIDALNLSSDVLKPDDFFIGWHRLLFGACLSRYRKGHIVEAYQIISDLGDKIDNTHISAILNYRNIHSLSVDLTEYVERVSDASALRQLYFSAESMGTEALSAREKPSYIAEKYTALHSSIVERSDKQASRVSDIFKDFNKGSSFEEYVRDKLERVKNGESPYHGVKSYYPRLDETIGSFQNGCLHYIGARTSMGKTTFIMNLIQNIMNNEPETLIAFMSLEMTKETIAAKLLCMKACVPFKDYSRLQFNEESSMRLFEAQRLLSDSLIIDDSPLDIAMLSSRIRRFVRADKAKIVFIDYLTCIKATENFNTSHEKVNQVSKALLSLAKELNIPIVCLAQLNRSVTARTDKTPTLADFRESGSIEEDADVCMLLHRPQYYDKYNTDSFTHVIIAKNRLLGELKELNYSWDQNKPGIYTENGDIKNVMASDVARSKEGVHSRGRNDF